MLTMTGNTAASPLITNCFAIHTDCCLAGELFVNGVESTEANHRQAYVEQSDNFYSMLSVAETLTMAAQLQMAPGLPEASKQSYVDNLISVLGLAKVRNIYILNSSLDLSFLS
jgi:ABC-type multidrug transport system ATPase subunit